MKTPRDLFRGGSLFFWSCIVGRRVPPLALAPVLAATITILMLAATVPATGYTHSGDVFSAFAAVVPVIDGTEAPAEWADADCKTNTVTSSAGNLSDLTICVKNDATYLYMLVRVTNQDYSDVAEMGYDFLNLYFDNAHDGGCNIGDDYLNIRFDGLKVDSHNPNGVCIHSSTDLAAGGTDDLSAAITHTNPVPDGIGTYTAEYRQPLNSPDDAHDFSLGPGSVVGFIFTMADGDESGHFSWPGTTPDRGAEIIIAGTPPPAYILDHFKCYQTKSKQPQDPKVMLGDQFGTIVTRVIHAGRFCNAVEKAHDGRITRIQDEDAHLVFYQLEPVETPVRDVAIRNQFGEQKVLVKNPRALAVPTQKLRPNFHEAPQDLDHFLCYDADGRRMEIPVGLRDQFTQEDAVVLRASLFCNPARKRHGNVETGIKHPEAHLTCYDIVRTRFDGPVVYRNQFEFADTRVGRADLLCVPTEKGQVVTPDPAG